MPETRLPRSATRVVDDAVRRAFGHGVALNRADLQTATGLSRSALQGAVDRLVDTGELLPAPAPGNRGTGRPAQHFRLVAARRTTPVVVLEPAGGTVVVAAGTDDVERATHAAAPWHTDLATWSASVAATIRDALADEVSPDGADAGVVVSVPFPFAAGRGVALHSPATAPLHDTRGRRPVPDWLLTDPTPTLRQAFGRPVAIVNDIDLVALAEVHHGVAQGARTAVVVAVRDGLGAAVVVDGRVTTGAHGMTGELAHAQAVPDGPLCGCGSRGCLATQTLSPSVVDALTLRYGQPVTFADMETLVGHDDPVAVRFLTDLGRLVAGPLATVVGFLDPDVVVVDGTLGAAAGPFTRGLVEVFGQRLPPAVTTGLRLVTGTVARPGVVGAATVGDALSSGRLEAVLRTTTPPPPGRAEEASSSAVPSVSARPEPSPPPAP